MTVAQLLDKVVPRLTAPPALPFVDAVNAVSTALFKRLLALQADFIISDLSVTVAANQNSGTLPDNFYGLRGRPYVSGRDMERLQGSPARYAGETGPPAEYLVRGGTIRIFPAPPAQVTVTGEYFAQPATVADMAGTIPYTGRFDEVYREGVMRLLAGTMGVDQEFEIFVAREVDRIILSRDANLPKRRGVSYF